MNIPLYQVDAFAASAFTGNPAAVCFLESHVEADWMQSVAMEMNLSETAFVHRLSEGFSLRWFTPNSEVDLCGHATLATAHVLWESGRLPESEEAHFHTRSGLLKAIRNGEWIEMDFPSDPASAMEPVADVLRALGGVHPRFFGKNRDDYLLEVDDEATLRSLQPDYRMLKGVTTRGVIVTSRSMSSDYDFVSRFFAPAVGIDEDPVTGSAHCCLGPYWASQLGKSALTAYQASSRGGEVRVRIEGDRVKLGGRAITVVRGELAV